jgi:hypothetical protein
MTATRWPPATSSGAPLWPDPPGRPGQGRLARLGVCPRSRRAAGDGRGPAGPRADRRSRRAPGQPAGQGRVGGARVPPAVLGRSDPRRSARRGDRHQQHRRGRHTAGSRAPAAALGCRAGPAGRAAPRRPGTAQLHGRRPVAGHRRNGRPDPARGRPGPARMGFPGADRSGQAASGPPARASGQGGHARVAGRARAAAASPARRGSRPGRTGRCGSSTAAPTRSGGSPPRRSRAQPGSVPPSRSA